jgi:hypothetical protein
MAIIRLQGFGGENRAIHPTLLNEAVGTLSLNQKPGRGDLRPWNAPLAVATVTAGQKTIYRMGREAPSDTQYWLSWPTEVHAARGPNQSDTAERTYFTGSGAPKWTDTIKALASTPYPTTARELGVPAPATSCLLSASGGTSTTLVTHFYTYTYVSDIGEESAPQPNPTSIIRKEDSTVNITSLAAAPSGNYGINKIRIYRTQSGASGSSEFYFLCEIPATLTSTVDDNRALGELLTTTTWLPPEPSMKWLTGMWNGMMAGIVGRAIRFCEAYVPYAWPLAYEVLPVDSTPVALATFGQTLVVLTDGAPRVVTGSSPESLDDAPVNFLQACIAPMSAVGMGHGVAWASPDGLAYIGDGGARMLTEGILTREDWQAMNPTSMVGCMYERRYFGFYTQGGVRKAFMLDMQNPGGMYFMDFGVDAVYVDDQQDALYVLDGVSIKKWDAGSALNVTFKSKIYQFPKPVNAFALLQVQADAYPVTVCVDAVGVPAADVVAVMAVNNLFTAPAASALRYSVTVASNAPVRLPGGYMADKYQVQAVGSVAIQSLVIAHSMAEMAQV